MDTQNTFPANDTGDNNINNIVEDIDMSDILDEGGVGTGLTPFDDFGSAGDFDFEGMGIDPTLPDDINLAGEMGTGSGPLSNEAVTSGTEDSSATGSNKHNPSEETSTDGHPSLAVHGATWVVSRNVFNGPGSG
ncbi:hypothetical protein MKX08_002543 [Trichoderma sp. CBMAI-0020]|nr:hypothetical protein MKX08_002543 [Trichoderma sp. CBMAI-0020]